MPHPEPPPKLNAKLLKLREKKMNAYHPFITFPNGRPHIYDARTTKEVEETRLMQNNKKPKRTKMFRASKTVIPRDLDGVHRADNRLDGKSVW